MECNICHKPLDECKAFTKTHEYMDEMEAKVKELEEKNKVMHLSLQDFGEGYLELQKENQKHKEIVSYVKSILQESSTDEGKIYLIAKKFLGDKV